METAEKVRKRKMLSLLAEHLHETAEKERKELIDSFSAVAISQRGTLNTRHQFAQNY